MSVANLINPTIAQQYLPVAYAMVGGTASLSTIANTEVPLLYQGGPINLINTSCSFADTKVFVNLAGIYRIGCSINFNKSSAGTDSVAVYPKVNGQPIIETGRTLTLTQNVPELFMSEWALQLNAGDYVEMIMYSASAGIDAVASFPPAPVPAITSYLVSVELIYQNAY
jgi:hypothetical protein